MMAKNKTSYTDKNTLMGSVKALYLKKESILLLINKNKNLEFNT